MINNNYFSQAILSTLAKALLSCLLISVLVTGSLLRNPPVVHAHAGGQHYHVAESGQDRGPCLSPLHPCRTIAYALRQAGGQGDEIRVAAGAYHVDRTTVVQMVTSLLIVQGGYTTTDYFATSDPDRHPTYLSGVADRYQPPLAAQGFIMEQHKQTVNPLLGANAAMPQATASYAACDGGAAAGYPCRAIDLLAHLPLDQLSTLPTTANDLWGHVDLNDQREYALLGVRNGVAIIDVTDPMVPREITTIPSINNLWRDIKTYQFYDQDQGRWQAYAYVTSEADGQGMQIIDLGQLPITATLATTYTGIAKAHNLYLGEVDYSTGVALRAEPVYAYLFGSNLNSGAFRILDLSNPTAPTEASAPPVGAQYVHDGTTLVITDTRATACAAGHNPCTLFVDYNENSVDLWDVTAKGAPQQISSTPYAGSQYTHSGWWSADKRYLFVQDELDEYRLGQNTRLRVLDLSSLTAPTGYVAWTGPTRAIDHNGFAKGTKYYMSNYERGLTILDVSTPTAATEAAFFDTYPAGDAARFNGAWGIYPFLPSGNLLVSDIQGGLFVLREAVPPTPTMTPSPTPEPTATSTLTPTVTPTVTPTPTMLPLPTGTVTATPVPITPPVPATILPTFTSTATATSTPEASATPTPTMLPATLKLTPTALPLATPTAVVSGSSYTIYLPVVSR